MTQNSNFAYAASLAELEAQGALVVQADQYNLVLFLHQGQIYALDNRCPHMGFPLHRGSVSDGILTCHWHHARFDLASGGTFDPWADDARSFPVEVRADEIWVDLTPPSGQQDYYLKRLQDGLERNIPLVLAKSVIHYLAHGDPIEPFRAGLDYGVRYRQAGWGQGLTIHTCTMNLIPYISAEDIPLALYHGLAAVANDTSDRPPRFLLRPLPNSPTDFETLKRWFRRFVEVRDTEGAERCLLSALQAQATPAQMAGMLFSAATDHRYIDVGHSLDFTNKALEALDIAGWERADCILTSLAPTYTNAARMEESNSWRHPVDLVALLETAFEQLPQLFKNNHQANSNWGGKAELISVLLEDNPEAITAAMLGALGEGCRPVELAGIVAYAAALRIARFHTSNEFGDWDTALHTFTFANAVHQGMRRAPSLDLLRGVFDAAMSVYLDRFLNIPPARLPEPNGRSPEPASLLEELSHLLDRQQKVDEAGVTAARYLFSGGHRRNLYARLGHLLLREDRNFHTIQTIEAAFRLSSSYLPDTTEAVHGLVAAARYLAAHSPTMRAQGQTFKIAQRLAHGERLHEAEP